MRRHNDQLFQQALYLMGRTVRAPCQDVLRCICLDVYTPMHRQIFGTIDVTMPMVNALNEEAGGRLPFELAIDLGGPW